MVAAGCLVQWYEIELVEEYLQSVKNAVDMIDNKKDVIIDLYFNTDETLEKLGNRKIKHLAVATPGFSADNIETLEEINIEGREEFMNSGGEKFTFIPCLNDSEEGMKLLYNLTVKELGGWI